MANYLCKSFSLWFKAWPQYIRYRRTDERQPCQ